MSAFDELSPEGADKLLKALHLWGEAEALSEYLKPRPWRILAYLYWRRHYQAIDLFDVMAELEDG